MTTRDTHARTSAYDPEAFDRLPDGAADLFGADATAGHAYDLLTVDVPAASWITALETARDTLGCTYFDWLSAVDEPGTGFHVCAHVASLEGGRVRRLLLRTTVPHDTAVLPTAVGVYAGAAWHERETAEMFGVVFEGHPNPAHLLLPDNFEGHPLRKDFVLAARVAKAWPGAKEPGESEHGGPKRRQMLPPGVPDPNDWGPLKGQLPPAPARPARAGRAGAAGAGGAGGAVERPRRTRTASQGSASQTAPAPAEPPATGTAPAAGTAAAGAAPTAGTAPSAGTAPEAPAAGAAAAGTPDTGAAPGAGTPRPRRTRTAGEGSPTQRRSRSAGEGSASQREAAAPPEAPAPGRPAPAAPPRTRSADAPWNNPRPAFDDPAEPTEPAGPSEPAAPAEPAEPAAPAEPAGPAGPRARKPRDAQGPEGTRGPEGTEGDDA
ncbi:NADH-quinone oxidoreductase subunit C [Streptomyces sp. NPDC030392]|uniref:NADH-quinone oxidoreductase subunit C n=1 Tax=Streptomyces sp. NPDC030392 TaxID=3155468 RepID=UPI0033C9F1F0